MSLNTNVDDGINGRRSRVALCAGHSKSFTRNRRKGTDVLRITIVLRLAVIMVLSLPGVVAFGEDFYRAVLTVNSELPAGNVPMSATIDFGEIVRDNKLPGVFDPNSIVVINLATKEPVIFARTEDFSYSDRGRLEWVIADPEHRKFEIRFRTTDKRPPLQPQDYTPAVGVGDLLRFNAGPSRPITSFYASALADLTGDGRQDLVGCWNYAYRPGDPWSGLICYPRLNADNPEFGDLVRPRYVRKADEAVLHKFGGGYYVSCNLADFNKDGNIDIVLTSASTKSATFYLNTGRAEHSGMPIFTPSGSVKVSKWNSCQAVDLDGDGALDLVVDGKFIRNQNAEGWPFQSAEEVALTAGHHPCFVDVDHDGRPDAVALKSIPGEGIRNYAVAWWRNIGGETLKFKTAKVLPGINRLVRRPRGLSAVNDGAQRGVLVHHDDYQRLSFFALVNRPGEPPRFEHRYPAESRSAVMTLGDQAWPCLCDWDGDGDTDLLVGGGYGWPRIVINEGTRQRPSFSKPKFILAAGKPIRFVRKQILGPPNSWHNMGYPYPVSIDWDGDGLPDLVCPNETNRIFWYRNVGTRKEPKFNRRLQILCDGYPDSPELRTLSAKRAADKNSNNGVYPREEERPFRWRTAAAFADFNGDGLMDFITCDSMEFKATLFVQYKDKRGQLRVKKWVDDDGKNALRLVGGREIDDSTVRRKTHWTEGFRAVDWDGDGLMDVMYSLAGSQGGIQDGGSIYLLRNCGTRTVPVFENPVTMRCYGKPIRVTNHGPNAWPGDFDGDGKPDLLAGVEAGVYPFYSHNALQMGEPPQFTLERAPSAIDGDR